MRVIRRVVWVLALSALSALICFYLAEAGRPKWFDLERKSTKAIVVMEEGAEEEAEDLLPRVLAHDSDVWGWEDAWHSFESDKHAPKDAIVDAINFFLNHPPGGRDYDFFLTPEYLTHQDILFRWLLADACRDRYEWFPKYDLKQGK